MVANLLTKNWVTHDEFGGVVPKQSRKDNIANKPKIYINKTSVQNAIRDKIQALGALIQAR